MQMNPGFDGNILDEFLTSAETNKKEEDEDLEIERKYYQKPDIDPMSPIGAMPFLQNFVQGM